VSPHSKHLNLPEARENVNGYCFDQSSRKPTYSDMEARFARAEMMSSGMVLKKHTAAMRNHPVSRELARAASPFVRLSQI
jgi:hypothetical protein